MKIPDPIYDQYYFSSPENQEAILRVVENLLAEQKKELIEKLDEMAFENDNGYKVELFINWDEAKVSLKHHD